MRRTPPLALALACALAIPTPAHAVAAAPAAGAQAASATTAGTARAGASDVGGIRSSSSRTAVSTQAANSRMSQVLRSRTVSRVLGPRFTMTVWDTATGRFVYQRRSSASLRGASTTKVLTTVGALAALGPDHRFPTAVRAGATPDEVLLVAGGDPLLTSADLRELAAQTAAALTATPDPAASAPAGPATPITVRADDSLFSGPGQSRGWPNSYLPREVRPVGAFARDDNKARDATADAGKYFAAALRDLGVGASYAGEATASPDSATVASIPGHSVAESASRMLLISDNDTAEMLFRHIAVARGLPGTWEGARQGLADTLAALNVPLTGVRIVDGSGLSLDDRLTAGALTAALALAVSPDHPELSGLRGWLPVAGRTGTLRASYKRFSSRPARCAAGLIQAKTGTVADAIALAGYAAGADGQTKVFVSIVNSRPTRYSRLTTRRAVDRAASSITGCW